MLLQAYVFILFADSARIPGSHMSVTSERFSEMSMTNKSMGNIRGQIPHTAEGSHMS